jgi:hypothetical protein
MDIGVVKVTELEDGSADVELRLDEEAKTYLMNYAFNDILSAALNDIEKLHKKGIQVEISD